jgi:hypothetical protein
MSRVLVRVGVLAGLAVLLAGCGDRPGYDRGAVEHFLATSQAGTFGGDLEVGKASCPKEAAVEEGMTVRCTLAVSGSAVPYRVTLRDVHGKKVKVTAKPDAVIVPGAAVRDFVRTTLPKESKGADVDCGGGVIVAKVGQTLDCTLTLGAQTQPLKVTVTDKAGTIAIA